MSRRVSLGKGITVSATRRLRGFLAVCLVIMLSVSIMPNRAQAADGDLDPTFGVGGKVVTDFFGSTDEASAVVLQPDGKIIAVGEAFGSSGAFNFGLARYDGSGNPDPAFGTGGKVTTDFSGSNGQAGARALALQPDGKIVVAGFVVQDIGGLNFALARYDSNGSLDSTFGIGGKVTTDLFGSTDQAFAMALQPDGKIVVAGSTMMGSLADFALVRYDGSGNLDPAFGAGGKVATDFSVSFDAAFAIALQPDGKIVAAGATIPRGLVGEIVNPSIDFALARYQSTPACTLSLTNASVDKPVLWPANHKMVPVNISYNVNNTCPTNCTLSVSSNEPINGTGDGDTAPDWQVVNANRVNLRAERAGNGSGRIYTIGITCRDSAGNAAGRTVTVSVPHDRR